MTQDPRTLDPGPRTQESRTQELRTQELRTQDPGPKLQEDQDLGPGTSKVISHAGYSFCRRL